MKLRVIAEHTYDDVRFRVQRKRLWWWEDIGSGSFTSEQTAIKFADEGIVRWETPEKPTPISRWGSYQ